ncbi:hypothetical protein BKA62DRAFT_683735 [Auriculariales sp. MPI-PUGE-AT-0066]|nr:hypothetical protein BKA62DRAFT_683735 [Auriculariales sp. MPI-PUGE-AT-0066]
MQFFTRAAVFAVLAVLAGTTVALPSELATHELEARGKPAHWSSKLESYKTYHTRYMELECSSHKNTKFFKVCCGPLKKKQKLSSRPAACDPDKTFWADDCGNHSEAKY